MKKNKIAPDLEFGKSPSDKTPLVGPIKKLEGREVAVTLLHHYQRKKVSSVSREVLTASERIFAKPICRCSTTRPHVLLAHNLSPSAW